MEHQKTLNLNFETVYAIHCLNVPDVWKLHTGKKFGCKSQLKQTTGHNDVRKIYTQQELGAEPRPGTLRPTLVAPVDL